MHSRLGARWRGLCLTGMARVGGVCDEGLSSGIVFKVLSKVSAKEQFSSSLAHVSESKSCSRAISRSSSGSDEGCRAGSDSGSGSGSEPCPKAMVCNLSSMVRSVVLLLRELVDLDLEFSCLQEKVWLAGGEEGIADELEGRCSIMRPARSPERERRRVVCLRRGTWTWGVG